MEEREAFYQAYQRKEEEETVGFMALMMFSLTLTQKACSCDFAI